VSNNPSRKISRQQQAASRRQKHEASRTPWLVGLGVAAVLAIAVVAGIVASGGDDGDDTPAFAEILGPPLPPYPGEGVVDPALGTPAPGLIATSFEGQQRTVRTGDGPMILAFFAHWCPVCQAELPVVVEWLESGGLPAEVEFLAVSTDVRRQGGNHPPEDWFAREGYPLAVLEDGDDRPLAVGHGLQSYPYFVVVDAEGTVVARSAGARPVEDLDAMVAAALS
jgi:cytochrome c biogenesis protein CcmG, thiol:disulfide interchange protein DsbE